MVECCKGGVCYIVTEKEFKDEYEPKGFINVGAQKKETVSAHIEPAQESVVENTTEQPRRGRRKK